MEKVTFKTVIIILLGSLLLSFTTNNRSFQTECVSLETEGYITLKIWDISRGKSYNAQLARKDAVAAILFSGVSGTNGCITQPPILNKADEQQNFKTIEKEFFSKKGKWIVFTRSSAVETTMQNSIDEKKLKVYQVSVSRDELRKYLEEQKVIKPLNSGF